jgi:hypothetical protein
MNKKLIPKDGTACGKRIDLQFEPPRFSNSAIRSPDMIERQLIWSSQNPADWEILVYKQGERWEACFFRWPSHHEHAAGTSFASVRQRAEQRIRVLESALK